MVSENSFLRAISSVHFNSQYFRGLGWTFWQYACTGEFSLDKRVVPI